MRETGRRFVAKLSADALALPPSSLARQAADLRRELWLLWLTSPLGRLMLWLAEGGWRR